MEPVRVENLRGCGVGTVSCSAATGGRTIKVAVRDTCTLEEEELLLVIAGALACCERVVHASCAVYNGVWFVGFHTWTICHP